MTDIEGFLTIYGHSDNLLNNKCPYISNNGNVRPWKYNAFIALKQLFYRIFGCCGICGGAFLVGV